MLRILCLAGALLAGLPALRAQSLSTIFTGGNGLGANSTIYFDLVVNLPLTFQQLDVHCSSAASTSGSLEVRWTPGSYVGNATNAGAWTLGGTGTLTSAGPNVPTNVPVTPFTLSPGNYGIAVTFLGVGQTYTDGNGTIVPGSGSNQTYSNSELTMLCGASSASPPGTGISFQPRVFNGALHYVISGSGTAAQRSTYGTGCYRRPASLYESFATSAAFDLSNNGFTMLPTGNGYLVLPAITGYVPPSTSATTLTLADDGQTPVTLASPFPYAGGVTTTLNVASNGIVSVATGNTATHTPSVTTFLAAPQTAWWNWHDYNPSITAGGRVKFEQIGATAYVTWDGVWDYSGTSAANANTFQFQFDTSSGTVSLLFQTMSALGNARLVGYSPGGPSMDPGNRDLSALIPLTLTLPASEEPLALNASARPVLGTSIQIVTSNETGQNLGVNFLSPVQIPAPGVDLGVIGAPGCPALIDVTQAIGNVIGNTGLPGIGMGITLPIPNNTALNGLAIFSQSIWLDPTANAFGITASNGLRLVLGNL